MTEIAYRNNCAKCQMLNRMWVSRFSWDNRPCPMDRKGKKLSPGRVKTGMKANWVCPNREVK